MKLSHKGWTKKWGQGTNNAQQYAFEASDDQRQLKLPFALRQGFCYRSPVVASVKCYQTLEAYDGQENQLADEKGIA